VLVTGPDIAQSGGAGIQQHVRYLMSMFAHDEAIEIRPFAITSVVRDESWLLKGSRLLWKYVQLMVSMPGVDLVHVNSTIDNRSIVRDSGALLIAALWRRPTVLQFHGGDVSCLTHLAHGWLFRLARRAVRGASRVLFLSTDQGVPVVELFDVDSSRVEYVSNFVPVEDYAASPRPIVGDLRVLYLGRLHPSKGVTQTVQAFARVSEPQWELRVAGAGPQEAEVRSAISSTPRSQFLGFVQGAEKQALLDWADVFVLPSAHFEGMPYGALEALASGLALVASANAGLARLLRDGWNGIVVPPLDTDAVAQALQHLSASPELVASMGAHSRQLAVAEYSLSRGREVFSAIYFTAAGMHR
jgi:glycosyltransferase involved in cell wall biosynthesis